MLKKSGIWLFWLIIMRKKNPTIGISHIGIKIGIFKNYCKKSLLNSYYISEILTVVGIFERSPKLRDGRSCGNGTYDLSRKYGSTRRHVSATVWGSGAHDGN